MLKVEGAGRSRLSFPNFSRIIAAVMLILFSWAFFLMASSAQATGISQGYSTTDNDLRQNMIAALSSESSDDRPVVERANNNNRSKVVGIVTTIDANLLTLTSSEAKVHIATSGEALTYVTDVNGAIKKGDFITVSPLTGVGMKGSEADSFVVGVALEDFNSETAESQQVSTTQGSERTVLINRVKIDVEPRDLGKGAQAKTTPVLLLFGQSVTGKSVTQTQVLVALVIFLLLLIVEGSIIYGAIHSTIVSIGRNPLARRALYKQLLQVSWLALLVLVFGAGAIYAILWL